MQANFVMREMGYPGGARTRREAAADYGGTLFVVPIVCSGLLVGSAPVCGRLQ